jgi:hypothetical protein
MDTAITVNAHGRFQACGTLEFSYVHGMNTIIYFILVFFNILAYLINIPGSGLPDTRYQVSKVLIM